jgi:hypothetical protein
MGRAIAPRRAGGRLRQMVVPSTSPADVIDDIWQGDGTIDFNKRLPIGVANSATSRGTRMPAKSKAQEFRDRAENCRRQAERCTTDKEKQHWSSMAQEWLRMAEDAAIWCNS